MPRQKSWKAPDLHARLAQDEFDVLHAVRGPVAVHDDMLLDQQCGHGLAVDEARFVLAQRLEFRQGGVAPEGFHVLPPGLGHAVAGELALPVAAGQRVVLAVAHQPRHPEHGLGVFVQPVGAERLQLHAGLALEDDGGLDGHCRSFPVLCRAQTVR